MPVMDILSPSLPDPPEFPEGRIEARRHPGWEKLQPDIQQLVDAVDTLEQRHERSEAFRQWQTQCMMALQRSLITTQRIMIVLLVFWVVSNGPMMIGALARWIGIEHPPVHP